MESSGNNKVYTTKHGVLREIYDDKVIAERMGMTVGEMNMMFFLCENIPGYAGNVSGKASKVVRDGKFWK